MRKRVDGDHSEPDLVGRGHEPTAHEVTKTTDVSLWKFIMNPLIKSLLHIPAIIVFLFIFWKRLKEDYSTTLIFNSAFVIIVSVLVGNLIAIKFFPSWWFWASVFGAIAGYVLSVIRFKLAIHETLEALVISLLPWLGSVFVFNFITGREVATGIGFFVIAVLIFSYFLLDMHYKSFTWYKSGRVGFSGLTILGIFFLLRAAIAIIFPDVLSFTGNIDAILSSVFSFASFIAVFNLSRSVS